MNSQAGQGPRHAKITVNLAEAHLVKARPQDKDEMVSPRNKQYLGMFCNFRKSRQASVIQVGEQRIQTHPFPSKAFDLSMDACCMTCFRIGSILPKQLYL